MKNHFSPRLALPTTFFLYTLITLVILNTEFGLVWTTPWSAEKELFLKFSKIHHSRNSQNSVWKPNFFLGTLNQILFCFTLSLHWWYSIPSLVWFGQLLDPMKNNFFLKFSKIRNSRNSRNSVWKLIFFLCKLYQQLWLYTIITLVILNTEFGLIWATPWPDEKQFFFKILKNSQFAKFAKLRMKNHFSPRQALPTTFFFTLSLHWWY